MQGTTNVGRIMTSFVKRILPAFVLAALVVCTIGQAQVTTATIYGTVQDPSGAVIPGANIPLRNQGTGAILPSTTGADGDFNFSVLPVGSYTLNIVAQGFKTLTSRNIALAASQVVRQTFTLELGQISETVSVDGGAPLI